MAQNPCISREEYLLDEARRELEASELADDNQLRNTIARLVGFVEELVGDEPSRPPEAEPGKIKLLVTVAGSEEIEVNKDDYQAAIESGQLGLFLEGRTSLDLRMAVNVVGPDGEIHEC